MTTNLYQMSPKWKKSLVETETFLKEEKDYSVYIDYHTIWRSGEFVVILNEQEFNKVNNKNEYSVTNLSNYIYEFISTWDGVGSDWDIRFEGDVSEEEKSSIIENIQENLEENGSSWLWDQESVEGSFYTHECEYYIEGEVELNPLPEDQYEDYKWLLEEM